MPVSTNYVFLEAEEGRFGYHHLRLLGGVGTHAGLHPGLEKSSVMAKHQALNIHKQI